MRIALGAQDRGLQQGGILVAEEMYRAETIEHNKLTKEILGYYSASSPVLRRGVLDWLLAMDKQLSSEEARLAHEAVKTSFGENGELCPLQDEAVAVKAANFLNRWSLADSKSLLLGIATRCKDESYPNKFVGARESAVQALPSVAHSLSREQCENLWKRDLPELGKGSIDLGDLIDQATASIQATCASK